MQLFVCMQYHENLGESRICDLTWNDLKILYLCIGKNVNICL